MSTQNRLIMTCISLAGLLTVWACKTITVNNIVYPSTLVPNGTIQPISIYDGDWAGIISNSSEIAFTITRGEVVALNGQVELFGSNCFTAITLTTKNIIEPTALANGNFTPVNPIQNGAFIINVYENGFIQTAAIFVGKFSSPDAATGTFEYTAVGTECDGTITVNWLAEKISR